MGLLDFLQPQQQQADSSSDNSATQNQGGGFLGSILGGPFHQNNFNTMLGLSLLSSPRYSPLQNLPQVYGLTNHQNELDKAEAANRAALKAFGVDPALANASPEYTKNLIDLRMQQMLQDHYKGEPPTPSMYGPNTSVPQPGATSNVLPGIGAGGVGSGALSPPPTLPGQKPQLAPPSTSTAFSAEPTIAGQQPQLQKPPEAPAVTDIKTAQADPTALLNPAQGQAPSQDSATIARAKAVYQYNKQKYEAMSALEKKYFPDRAANFQANIAEARKYLEPDALDLEFEKANTPPDQRVAARQNQVLQKADNITPGYNDPNHMDLPTGPMRREFQNGQVVHVPIAQAQPAGVPGGAATPAPAAQLTPTGAPGLPPQLPNAPTMAMTPPVGFGGGMPSQLPPQITPGQGGTFGAVPSEAFGPTGVITGVGRKLESLAGTTLSPEQSRREQDVTSIQSLNNELTDVLKIPGLKMASKWAASLTRETLPGTREWMRGSDRALAEYKGLMPTLDNRIALAQQSVNDSINMRDRTRLQENSARLRELQSVRQRTQNLIDALDANAHGQANPESNIGMSGPNWKVIGVRRAQ